MHLPSPKVMGEGHILAAGQACESLSKSPVRLCHLSPEQRLDDILKEEGDDDDERKGQVNGRAGVAQSLTNIPHHRPKGNGLLCAPTVIHGI